MEYQKIINSLDDTMNQPFKFRTRNWIEINDKSRGDYNDNHELIIIILMMIIIALNLKRHE